MASLDRTMSQLGGGGTDGQSLEVSQIIDFSNLRFNVQDIDNRVRMGEAKAKILEQKLKQQEQLTNKIEGKAQHLGKYLIKQQAKLAALNLVQSVTEESDLPIGARGIVNIGMQTAYGAMSTPGNPLIGAGIGLTYSTIHQLWNILKEHEFDSERTKKVIKQEHDARTELEAEINRRFLELSDMFERKLKEAISRQQLEDAELEYQTAVAAEE